MAVFEKRAAVYIRKSDEYGTNHPNWGNMSMNGFTVPLVRPPEIDPYCEATIKSARGAGLFPGVWEVPKTFANNAREPAKAFAERLDKIVGDLDKAGAYTYVIVSDNEQLSIEWHREFAPLMASKRTRQKWLSIDPQQADVWAENGMYVPYIENGFAIDVQCYGAKMEYFDIARCWSLVCACNKVRPWKVRVTLTPAHAAEALPTLRKMGPIGIGIFSTGEATLNTDLALYGPYVSGSVLPQVIAYK